MARRLFLAGRLRAGLMLTRRFETGVVDRTRAAAEPVARTVAPPSPRALAGAGEGRSTFAVGRRSPERSGVRSVQFPRARTAPVPGPWALAAVVTGEA